MENNYIQNIVTTKEQFALVLDKLREHKYIVFDLETTGFSFLTERIVGIGVGTIDDDLTKITSAVYIPVEYHDGIEELFPAPRATTHLDREIVFKELAPFFLDFEKIIIGHNLKFDIQFMINEGIDLREKLAMPKWNVPPLSREGLKTYIDTLPKEASCADTMIMSWLLDENKNKHGLKDLAKNELNLDMSKLDKILGKKFMFHEAPASQTLPYALMDIIATAKLFMAYLPKIKAEKLDQVFWKVEMPFVGVVQAIERRGMPVNRKVLETIGERAEKEMNEIQTEIFQLAGKVFNINASAQLAQILHEECGLPIVAKTSKGAIKTDKATLEQILELGKQHKDQLKYRHHRGLKIIEKVLEFRKLKKVHGTYIDSILEKIDVDGRLHAGFHQTGTVTGRLSSSEPNLQNLPAGAVFKDYITPNEYWEVVDKLEADLRMKHGFPPKYQQKELPPELELELEILIQKHFMFTIVPVHQEKPGKYVPCKHEEAEKYEIQWKIRDAFQDYINDWWLIVGDYGQMELRMTAHLTGDRTMTQGFVDGHDIHKYNASIVTGKDIDSVTSEERRDAKAVSFGLVYGKTVRGFSIDWYGNEPDFWVERPSRKNEFGVINKKYTRQTQIIVDRFFAGFPDVAAGIEACHRFVERYGYVKMITGRKRRLPEVFSLSNGIKNRAKRQAFNAKVQGSSADFIKMAMVMMERELYIYNDGEPTYMLGQLAQVHDELLVATRPEDAQIKLEHTKDIMENVIKLSCPIVCDLEIGFKYGSAK